ncbi:MAG: FAD-binding oxidoreductase [Bauldia sp.]
MDRPLPDRLAWQEAEIVKVIAQTATVKSFVMRPKLWSGFSAGQHVDVRLVAPDGYQAQRSYSIASAPQDRDTIELAIERLPGGEVSAFFHEVVVPGDTVEIRGPIGGHFNWHVSEGGPLLLIGGGSGIVPLMSMARYRALAAPEVPAALVYSARAFSGLIFHDELLARAARDANFSLLVTLTGEGPREGIAAVPPVANERDVPGARRGRIDASTIAAMLDRLQTRPRWVYVCGGTGFVDAASTFCIAAGLDPKSIRTERFGGSS